MYDLAAQTMRPAVSVPEPGAGTVEGGLVEELRFGDGELFVRINGSHPSRQIDQSTEDLVRDTLRELAALPGIGDKAGARGRFARSTRITILDSASEVALQVQGLNTSPVEPVSN
jgi:hypothetical protein